ncbi:MAG: hypothetical protein R2712_08395 [Vicinamibacterales bacterium]
MDPATGRPYTFTQLTQDIGDRDLALRFNYLNLFVQDEMRVRDDLAQRRRALRAHHVPRARRPAPYPLSRRINNDTGNLAPRVGFTWRPGGSQGTAIRGGYGMFYDSTSLNLVLSAAQVNGRRVLSYTVPGSDSRAPAYPNLLATADPAFATPPSITVFSDDFDVMFAHQASLGVERQLGPQRCCRRPTASGITATRRTRGTSTSAPCFERWRTGGRVPGSANRPDRRSARSISWRAAAQPPTTASTCRCATACRAACR